MNVEDIDPKTHAELLRISNSPSFEARLVARCKFILSFLDGMSVSNIATKFRCSVSCVRKWRDRFLKNPVIHSLNDAERAGRPGVIAAGVKCQIMALACTEPPQDEVFQGNVWTLSALSAAGFKETGVKVSTSEIQRILSNKQIRPHKEKMWLHSPDPEFASKAEEICGLYLNPPEGAAVVCVDEKTGMQAIERKHPTKSAQPGKAVRVEFEYKRHGTQSLISSYDVITGGVYATCGKTRTADDLVEFMEELAGIYDEGDVHIIWDNLNIHKGDRWNEFNKRHSGRFHFHYTPLHASWLNQIEIFFSILQKRVLKRSSFLSEEELQTQVLKFIDRWNEFEAHPFKWNFRGKFQTTSELKAA
jgi:transposase